jgi:hypothetical protein
MGAHDLDVHVGEEWLVGDLGERRRLALAAHRGGAIDENIDTAKRVEHLGHSGLDGGIIASVGDVALHAAFRRSRDFCGGGLERSPISRKQGDIDTLLRQLPRDSLADAAVATSDDGDLVPGSKSKGSPPLCLPSAFALRILCGQGQICPSRPEPPQ